MDNLVFGHVYVQQQCCLVATFDHQFFQFYGLVLGAGEAVEYQSFGFCGQAVDVLLQHLDGHLVRHELSLADVRVDEFAQLASGSHLCTHQLSCGEVRQPVFVYYQIRLCALAAARGAT